MTDADTTLTLPDAMEQAIYQYEEGYISSADLRRAIRAALAEQETMQRVVAAAQAYMDYPYRGNAERDRLARELRDAVDAYAANLVTQRESADERGG